MLMKYDRNMEKAFILISKDEKLYKNAIISAIKQSKDYQRCVSIENMKNHLIQQLWLDYADELEWDDLVAVDEAKWKKEKRIELGFI